jgi:hypothetical protein
MRKNKPCYLIVGTFTLLGCLISLWDITSHVRHYNKPGIQRRVCAILWMVPIYGITSWFSLVFPHAGNVLGAIRDCYEAYAIYTFVGLLIAILAGEGGLSAAIAVIAGERKPATSVLASDSDLSSSRAAGGEAAGDRARPVNETTPLLSASAVRGKKSTPGITFAEDDPGNSKPAAAGDNEKPIAARLPKPPFACCLGESPSPRRLASSVIFQCQLMAMQFVFLKPLLAMTPFLWGLLLKKPFYAVPILNDSNHINWNSPEFYLVSIENISVMIAFYGLLSLYYATQEHLAWCNPWPKFLCIKGVVFVTFWQSIVLEAMGSLGLADPSQANQVQNLLICIEMLVASVAHYYVFPYEEWEEGYMVHVTKAGRVVRLQDSLALSDFATDMKRLVTKKSWGAASEGSTPKGNDADESFGNGSPFIRSNLSSEPTRMKSPESSDGDLFDRPTSISFNKARPLSEAGYDNVELLLGTDEMADEGEGASSVTLKSPRMSESNYASV